MLNKFKTISKRVYTMTTALLLLLFLLFMLITLIVEGILGADSITLISIVMAILSLPGIVNVLVDEFNPKRKVYKLTCKCPKCKHLITMDMKEE